MITRPAGVDLIKLSPTARRIPVFDVSPRVARPIQIIKSVPAAQAATIINKDGDSYTPGLIVTGNPPPQLNLNTN